MYRVYLSMLLAIIAVGCGAEQEASHLTGESRGPIGPSFQMAWYCDLPNSPPCPPMLEEIVVEASFDEHKYRAYLAFLDYVRNYVLDFGTTPTFEQYAIDWGGGDGYSGYQGYTPLPAPDSVPKISLPFSLDDPACPDYLGRTYLCLDFYISTDRAGPLKGDGRTSDPYADASTSRVQLVIFIENGDVPETYQMVSKTCLVYISQCFNVQPFTNSHTITWQNDSTFTVQYSFVNSLSTTFAIPGPAIQGYAVFYLGSNGSVTMGDWTSTKFPSADVYLFKAQGQTHHNVSTLGYWKETTWWDLFAPKMRSSYYVPH